MNKNQETKEKICTFYTSDYHFEMISLPYINKKIEENKEVVILTENNLEKTVKKLVSNINLNKEKKDKILSLNWKNDDLNKFKEINENVKKKKDMVVFVKGKENYIKNINKNIEKWTDRSVNTQIVDCYDLEEISERMDEVVGNYSRIIDTKGGYNSRPILN